MFFLAGKMWSVVRAWTLILLTTPVLSFSLAGNVVSSQITKKASLYMGGARDFPLRTAASPVDAEPTPLPPQPKVAVGGSDDDGRGSPESAAELVTEVLKKIEGTNRGVDCTPEQREEIDGIIHQLNTLGEGKDWLEDPQVFGNYNVAYVSSGSSERSNPAGGRWRGRTGRLLFRTEEMFQHLVRPSIAVNMIVFRAFGIFTGCVTLRGEFEAIPDKPNFVRASFDPPIVNFLGKRGLTIRSGPKSSVRLAATYVDERVRLGKGARGSLFIFTRGGPADGPKADDWKVYDAESSRPVKAKVMGVAVAFGAAAAAARSAVLPAGVLAVVSAALILSKGGVIDDRSNSQGEVEPETT